MIMSIHLSVHPSSIHIITYSLEASYYVVAGGNACEKHTVVLENFPHPHLTSCKTKGHLRVKNRTKSLYTQFQRVSFMQPLGENWIPHLCVESSKELKIFISEVAYDSKRSEDKYHITQDLRSHVLTD